jgi:hypothetical protein
MTKGAPHAEGDAYQHECHTCGKVIGQPRRYAAFGGNYSERMKNPISEEIRQPHEGVMKNPHAVALGRLGGKAGTGKNKGFARDPEKARAAAKKGAEARWGKAK